jgi:ribokinase
MDQPPRIVVIGSSNTDLVVRTARLPGPGETVLGGNLQQFPGGKGANQAIAAARLGAEVCFVTCLGCDSYGDQAMANFQRAGLNTDFVVRAPESPSGVALITVDERGQNQIVVASGANACLLPEHIDAARPAIARAEALVLQLEIPLPTVQRAVAVANELGVPVILNPAPVPIGNLPVELLRACSFIVPNQREACALLGAELPEEYDGPVWARRLRELGPEVAIITLGPQGAVAASRDGVLLSPTRRVAAVDTTGAGDCFVGALACAFAEGMPIAAMLRFANAAAALAVTRHGAQDSLPTRAELQAQADA